MPTHFKHQTMLRDYQQEMKNRMAEAWKSHRSVMVQMPTGTGKTHLLAEIVRQEKGMVLIVAHRMELIAQISETLKRYGIGHDTIVGGQKKVELQRVMVASIQTLTKRMEELEMMPDLIVVDEAHHALAKTYRMMWTQWKNARFLGLTATPCRLNMQGFTDLFDCLLEAWSIREFIRKGWLSDFEYISVCPESEAMKRVGSLTKRGADGDYQTTEMATVMDCEESIGHLYESYRHFAQGKRGIVYAINREHAAHIAERYAQEGVSAAVIDSKTPTAQRTKLVEEYRQGEIEVMVNVDIFSEGFDCPEVEFIQLARPTLSLSKYLQQVGRGMRTSPGKSHVMILDQVGLYQTFGLPTDERPWTKMFMGELAGKGTAGNEREIVLRNDPDDKMLMNLQMVRIKGLDCKQEGVEIFVKNGKYGVMKDGRITCQACFERMERLQGNYLLMGIYPYQVFRNRRTVIDHEGKDLKATLYGQVEQYGDFFKGKDLDGRTIYWDAKGGRSYPTLPQIIRAGRLELIKLGERYRPRQQECMLPMDCSKEEIYIGDQVTIMGDQLIIRMDLKKPYKIYGYLNNGILVGNSTGTFKSDYYLIAPDGHRVIDYQRLPWNTSKQPDLRRLKLKRLE